jgi:hypothetical protein
MRSWVMFTDMLGMSPSGIGDHHQFLIGGDPGKNDRIHQSGNTTSSTSGIPEQVSARGGLVIITPVAPGPTTWYSHAHT